MQLIDQQTTADRRQGIVELEHAIADRPDALTAADFQTRHHFADGSYGREIVLPADTVVVGKIHRHSHVNVISKGHCLVATEDAICEYRAPLTFVSKPGTKRAVLALTETIWTTVHVTDETDLELIEQDVIAPTFDDFDRLQGQIAELRARALQMGDRS